MVSPIGGSKPPKPPQTPLVPPVDPIPSMESTGDAVGGHAGESQHQEDERRYGWARRFLDWLNGKPKPQSPKPPEQPPPPDHIDIQA